MPKVLLGRVYGIQFAISSTMQYYSRLASSPSDLIHGTDYDEWLLWMKYGIVSHETEKQSSNKQ